MSRIVFCFLVLFCPASLFAFWPVYWEFDGKKNALGPLFTYEEQNGDTHVTARPLLSSYDSPGNFDIIYPLGKRTEDHAYFAPLYSRQKVSEEKQNASLLNVFWGRDGERSYGGVFPFYGRMYNRYGKDEIGFTMWPFYSYTVRKETTRTDVAWPFVSFYSGYEKGFKLWPLFGKRTYGNDRRSMFALWPFYISDEKGLNTEEPMKSTWFVPFYLHSESRHSDFYGVFWPFFTYLKVNDKFEINAPWPFIIYSNWEKEKKKSFALWPLYSHREDNKDEVTHILWPLYKESERHVGEAVWSEKRVLLFSKYLEDDRGTFFNVWPFFEYRQSPEEQVFFFPSIIPYRDKKFDRIVRPLITVFELHRRDESVITNFLYGFYTKEQKGESWKRRLTFLVEVKKEPEGMGFQILSGLLGIDKKTVKVFFIPISRSASPREECLQ
jgi:hypothetical protein